MRKPLPTTCFLLLLCPCIYAQIEWHSGKITEPDGKPVSFAGITIKGKQQSVIAKADGSFIIKAGSADTLVISAVNFATTAYHIQTGANALYVLTPLPNRLPDVVVASAFDTRQKQQNTTYNTQVITDEVLNIIPQLNLNDALAGKIAGVQTRSQSGAKLNSQGFLRVRGGLLLGGDAAPLFVVDGTIVNDGNDIDPSTIEDITILKGANATAIFGGSVNGAIVITTKKAKYNTSSIQFSQSLMADKVGQLPAFQDVYAGGGVGELMQYNWAPGHPDSWKQLDGKYYHDYTDDASWGPKMEGQEYVPWYAWVPGHPYSFTTATLDPQPDNISDFWETGLTSNTNLGFTKSGAGYNTRLSYTKQVVTGIIPNSKNDRNIVSGHMNVDVNKWISTGVDFSYMRQIVYGDFNDGFVNTTTGNFYQWNHRHLDMGKMKELRSLITPAGTTASWNWYHNPNAYKPEDPAYFFQPYYWFNFYTFLDNESIKQNRSRLFGNAFIKINITPDLDIKATIRMDETTLNTETKIGSILWPLTDVYAAGQQVTQITNYELLASYNRNISRSFTLNAIAGANIATRKTKATNVSSSGGLNIPNLYSFNNSVLQPSIGDGILQSKSNALFASANLGYRQYLQASITARQTWNSTLPEDDNSQLMSSAGLAFIPTALMQRPPSWLSFLKLYASWGQTPLAPGIYQTNSGYSVNAVAWNNNYLMTAGDVVPDKNLKGGSITSIEAGINFSVLNNRIGLNVNYYHEISDNQPVQITVDASSGLAAKVINAASVEREGLEFLLNATPVSSKHFTWTITAPVGWLINNPVTKIIEGQERVQPSGWKSGLDRNSFASAYMVLGEDWGQLIGGGFARNEEGIPLIDPATGLYITGDANYNYGSIMPKLTGGLQSFMTYNNFFFNFSIDYQRGGKFYSCSEYWGNYSGTLAPSAAINDKGANVRDPIDEDGGVHVTGVSSVDGKTPVDMYVSSYSYYRQFRTTRIAEPYIYSLSYIKLRELSIGYNMPVKRWSFTKGYMQAASVALIARNPWLIYSAAANWDPSEISFIYGEEGQLPPVQSYGINLSVTF